MQTLKPVVLLFGSSGGLGEALRVELARYYQVIGCDIEVKSGDLYVDLHCPNSMEQFYNKAASLPVEAIVFSSGFAKLGHIEELSFHDIKRHFTINLTSLIKLTHFFSDKLRECHGKVIFVGSTSAFLPSALWPLYAATKKMQDHFVRSLAIEWKGEVDIRIFHPGPIQTQMHLNLGMDLKKIGWDRFAKPQWMANKLVDWMMKGGARSYIPQLKMQLFIWGMRVVWFLFPERLKRQYG